MKMGWEQNFRVRVQEGTKEVFDAVCHSVLLLLCFWVPIQPILPIRTYRLVEVIIILMGAMSFAIHGMVRVPLLIRLSFWVSLAGWMVSTGFSPYIKQSIDVGTLEILVFYAVSYLATVHLRGQRDLVAASTLFAAGAAVIAVVQTVAIVQSVQAKFQALSSPLPLPVLASEFLRYKAAVPQLFPAGVPNSYGNIDNYASLCALLLPWLVGLLYVSRQRWLILGLFLIHAYAGLVVYSRGVVLVFVAAVCALWIFRFRAYGRLSPAICAVLVGTVFLHADFKMVSTFVGGVTSFVSAMGARPTASEAPSVRIEKAEEYEENEKYEKHEKYDKSPAERAQALSTGISIGLMSSMMGVGFGTYPTIDTALTSPHSLAVLRFAEGGLLGLIGFAMLAVYAPFRLLQVLKLREKHMLVATCLCAISAFMAKAVIFGANFSVSSNFVWGFGVALCLAGSLCEREEHAS
ncbi:hypothetical protein [Bradyrhizobium sp.]|uniref:hypothetical protein n=1 Tax=Bradyrhizobium sp. TaxID=376 RepID=UPI001D83DA69|nr:hypothetical protein [Bradyrhizobium sp.]MBI5321088.1 hypothetical protein [Bradyrhizobium sp.]